MFVTLVVLAEPLLPETGEKKNIKKFGGTSPLLSGDEKTNKHKGLLGIIPGMGWCQICLCVALLLGEKGNT